MMVSTVFDPLFGFGDFLDGLVFRHVFPVPFQARGCLDVCAHDLTSII